MDPVKIGGGTQDRATTPLLSETSARVFLTASQTAPVCQKSASIGSIDCYAASKPRPYEPGASSSSLRRSSHLSSSPANSSATWEKETSALPPGHSLHRQSYTNLATHAGARSIWCFRGEGITYQHPRRPGLFRYGFSKSYPCTPSSSGTLL